MKKIIMAAVVAVAVIAVLFVSWKITAGATTPRETLVTKVIDGDTVVIEGGEHVRLLGIDTDEKGYPCFDAAKVRLEELILNKRVTLEQGKEDTDQYGRSLRWIWLNDTLVNFVMVKEGLAVARFYGDSNYQSEIKAAEAEAIASRTGCKWSSL